MTHGENSRGPERTGTGVIRETAEPFEYFVEFLTVKHVPQLASLQHAILEVAPKPLPLYVRDEQFFGKCASECGCVVGAWHGNRLIGYALLYIPQHDEENYGTDLGLPDAELRYVGHLAGSGVEPLYRGNKIQSLLVDGRASFAERAGYYHVCGEVLPSNIISIQNHLSCGYFLKGFKIDRIDPSVDNYILHRDTRVSLRRTGDISYGSVTDIEWDRQMLADGRWGFEVEKPHGAWALACGKFEVTPR